jgi:hypothetical protein
VTPARCRNVKEVGQGFVPKLATEAPVNGGRNYDGPKVSLIASLSKTEPYAGNSSYSLLILVGMISGCKNSTGHGDNPQGRSCFGRKPSET